jgi:hypothetical protein
MRERHTRQVYCIACDLPVRVERSPAAAAASSTGTDTQAAAPEAAATQQQQQQQGGEARHAAAAGAGEPLAGGCTVAPAAVCSGPGANSTQDAVGVGHQSQANGQMLSKQQVSDICVGSKK